MKTLTSNLTVKIPSRLLGVLEARAGHGDFASAGEFVLAAVREKLAREANAELAAQIRDGIESGPPIRADAAFWAKLKGEVRENGRRSASKRRTSRR